jgi:hypothetical protein
MPTKTPEIREFFRLTVNRLPPSLLGDVMADLVKRGITEISHELVTEALTFKNNKQHETTGAELLEPWTVENPTFRARDVAKFFQEHGRTGAGSHFAIKSLVEKGVLRKLDENGHYARTDVKAIEGPKAKKKKDKPAKIERERHEIDHREFILRYMRQHGGRASRQKLMAYFEAHDRKPTSVGGALNMLIQKKMLKQLGEGEYVLLTKGGAKPAPKKIAPKKTAPKKSNGNGSHIVETPAVAPEVMTNG